MKNKAFVAGTKTAEKNVLNQTVKAAIKKMLVKRVYTHSVIQLNRVQTNKERRVPGIRLLVFLTERAAKQSLSLQKFEEAVMKSFCLSCRFVSSGNHATCPN